MKQYYTITENEVADRLDKVLVQQDGSVSRQQIQTWIKEQYVTVNDKFVKPNYRCKLNDEIVWDFPVEDDAAIKIQPENISLSILYEDDHILVINKPKGMLVHPTHKV